ncbi:hypothetical protein LR48_Vigan04g093300 [Vigna angularis]|uniref:Uncharacterized protein n=1 Tax=Phaseolus angularis TaxID=3914 RepID=A0A0L9UCS7_PHAAN|nr:hypothetical protein LR48_Vigan04g093300 [Vigna angularis]
MEAIDQPCQDRCVVVLEGFVVKVRWGGGRRSGGGGGSNKGLEVKEKRELPPKGRPVELDGMGGNVEAGYTEIGSSD